MWSGRRFVLASTLAAAVAWGVVVACGGSYGSSDSPSSPDAGGEAGGDAAVPVDPCAHVGVAPQPTTDDDPNTELPTFDLAVAEIDLLPDGGTTLGFDLDGVCTCDTRAGTAHDGGPSCVGMRICDDDGGVDNALPNLFTALSTLTDPGAYVNEPITRGKRTILVNLSHYNGRANDRDVTVGIILSEGIREPGCSSSVQAPDGLYTPGWCGDDHWSVSSASVLVGNGMVVPIAVGHGYVNDFRLVMEPTGRAALPFGEDETILVLGSPLIQATIVPLGTDLQPRDATKPPAPGEERFYALTDGVVGGRILVGDLLATLGSQELGVDGGFLCNSPIYAALKPTVCGAVDLATTSSLDFDPMASCAAVSAALGFRALPALAGDIVQPMPAPNPCLAGPDGQPVDASASYKCP